MPDLIDQQARIDRYTYGSRSPPPSKPKPSSTEITEQKVTTSYQVYLPAFVRSTLGLKKGDFLWVTVEDGSVVLTPVDPKH